MTQIAPEKQGRVFAANSLVLQSVSAIAVLIAGPLADHVFEPAMTVRGTLSFWLSPFFGSGPGAGTAILYTISSLGLLLIGIGGIAMPRLRALESDTK